MSSSSCSAGGGRRAWSPADTARAGARQPRVPQRRAVRRARARPAVAQPARPGEPASTKWFFYPGFTPRPAGCCASRGCSSAGAPSAAATMAGLAWHRRATPASGASACSATRTTRSATARRASPPSRPCCSPRRACRRAGHRERSAPSLARGALRAGAAAALTQRRLRPPALVVRPQFRARRGLVRARAIWAGAPFVWQLYVQDDGAHVAKLDAFLDRFLAGAPTPLGRVGPRAVRALERHGAAAAARRVARRCARPGAAHCAGAGATRWRPRPT